MWTIIVQKLRAFKFKSDVLGKLRSFLFGWWWWWLGQRKNVRSCWHFHRVEYFDGVSWMLAVWYILNVLTYHGLLNSTTLREWESQ